MKSKVIVVKNENFTFQETANHVNQINIKIDNSKKRKTTKANLFKANNIWFFSIEERKSYWGKGSNIETAKALDVNTAYEDMFNFIRMCNHGR